MITSMLPVDVDVEPVDVKNFHYIGWLIGILIYNGLLMFIIIPIITE